MSDTPAVMMSVGARVHSVDEEGNVALYCYSFDAVVRFCMGPAHTRQWAARIGDYVTLQVLDQKATDPVG